MEMERNPSALAAFKAFEVKNIEAVKGGDGDGSGDPGIIGTGEIGEG